MSREEKLKLQIIQKAWEDPQFKELLLTNPKAAIHKAFGISIPDTIELIALEEKTNQFYLVIPANPTEALDGLAEPNALW